MLAAATFYPITAATIYTIVTATIHYIATATVYSIATATLAPIATAILSPIAAATVYPIPTATLSVLSLHQLSILSLPQLSLPYRYCNFLSNCHWNCLFHCFCRLNKTQFMIPLRHYIPFSTITLLPSDNFISADSHGMSPPSSSRSEVFCNWPLRISSPTPIQLTQPSGDSIHSMKIDFIYSPN